jgi:tripartite-type tricarboxylate transporter receptor subunit TctC
VMFDNLPGAVEFIKTGKLRALGVTAAKRAGAIPDVPAIGEIVPGYEAAVWYGIVAARGTSSAIVDTLNKALNTALTDTRLKARLAELGGAAMPTTPTEFGKLLAEETEKWAKVIKFAGVKLD